MNLISKPMLAATIPDTNQLRLPLIGTPKIDGVRCLIVNGRGLSRSFKEIPNKFIQSKLWGLPNGLDGELVVGKNFQDSSSGIMSMAGEPDFTYWIFDYVSESLKLPYHQRLQELDELQFSHAYARALPYIALYTMKELYSYEQRVVECGYEGICLRSFDSPYKCGRSTFKEHYLLKLKRFVTAEAVVVGFEELQRNKNEATKGELGQTKRSSHKAGMVLAGTLGNLIVMDTITKKEFRVGSGFTAEMRQKIWDDKDVYKSQMISYKYQDYGIKDLPRLPIFLGFRDKRDM